jgi:maltose O-acetyltransferase
MNARLIAGSFAAYGYNAVGGHFPISGLRHAYLRAYLGKFGVGSSVQTGCRFLNGRKVFIGARNVINARCLLDGRRYQICTGDDVSIGPEATILTLGHDPNDVDFRDRGGDVIVGSRVWIAYRAMVLPGITIGEGAVVAAGAVVTRDVEAFTIVAGVPARPIAMRDRNLRYRLKFSPFLS